ncbi:hypothetical protein DPMN_140411 [Dreissena polymorpha]|uniref:B box-type domain-containing protein n=1 Tax=Dreissena polymorpha TaxID=45954 RepID=A0A9D4GAT6_DREPO|nr:hypothetical protein DPMN_140411 [Dreissena polymorpha]
MKIKRMEANEGIDFGPCPGLTKLMDLRCGACRGSISTYFCVECERYYCEQCKRSHIADKKHKHVIGRSTLPSERNIANLGKSDACKVKDTLTRLNPLNDTDDERHTRVNKKNRFVLSSSRREVEHGSTDDRDEDEVLTPTQFSTQIMGDKDKTDIGSMKVVEDETVLLSDIVNKKLKRFAFYGKEFILVGLLTFETQPWGITKLRDYVYIISLPQEMAYREVHIIGTTMNFGRRVNLGIPSPACAIVDETIIFVDTVNVHFVTTDLKGDNACETFGSEIEGKFSRPNFMFYSKNHKLLYINDPDNGVFGINMVQKIITFHYQSRDMLCPVELSEDINGNIIILGNESNNIHVVSKACSLEYVVSLNEMELEGGPSCICYLQHKDLYLLCTSESFTVVLLPIKSSAH